MTKEYVGNVSISVMDKGKRVGSNLWLWRFDNTGLYCVSSSEEEKMSGYVSPASAPLFLPGKLDTTYDGMKETECEIIPMKHKLQYPPVCSEWLLANFKMGSRPLVMIERRTIDLLHMNMFLVTSCADLVFVTQAFPEYSFLYRNQPRMILIIQIPVDEDKEVLAEGVPLLESLRKEREKWMGNKRILGSSTRFFAEIVKGEEIVLYSMGIGSEMIRRLRAAHLQWNRDNQVWKAPTDRVDLNEIVSIIREDTPLTPSIIGFVPEWYCDSLRVGSAQKEENVVENEIWEPVFGKL